MDDGAVLDIGASADADMIHIRADDAIIPDARIRADLHIANNLATGGDKGARMDFRALAAKRQYQWVHDYPSISRAGCKDRKSVVEGTRVSVRVGVGGRRIVKKKQQT